VILAIVLVEITDETGNGSMIVVILIRCKPADHIISALKGLGANGVCPSLEVPQSQRIYL